MKSQRGFTLFEILVVVGVIGILVALLITAVSKVKDEARDTQCLANLRRWGIALHLHMDRNNGELPALANAGDPLYAVSARLTGFLTDSGLEPNVAYSPAHPVMAANALSGEPFNYVYKKPQFMWGDIKDVDNSETVGAGDLPDDVVSDDPGATFEPEATWTSATPSEAYNNNLHYVLKADLAVTHTATYQFALPAGEGAQYKCHVAVWLVKKNNRTNDATYKFSDDNGSWEYHVNQWSDTDEAVEHQFPDEFLFTEGTTYQLTLDDSNTALNAYTIADAVLIKPFQKIGAVGETKEGFELIGSWNNPASSDGFYKGYINPAGHYTAVTATPENKALWWFTVSEPKSLYVAAWWKEAANRATSVTYDLYREDAKIASYTVNQQVAGSDYQKWDILSNNPVNFAADIQYRVELTSAAGGGSYVVADAICLVSYDFVELSRPMMGYLYLGSRASLPGTKHPGWRMVSAMRDLEDATSVPIMIDFITPDQPNMATHPTDHRDGVRGGHLLMMDGTVVWRNPDETERRWDDATVLQFYW